MCGELGEIAYMMKIMGNEQNAQRLRDATKEYSQQAATQLPIGYAATQVIFSRALGINYINAGSFSSVYNYLGNGQAVMTYKPVMQPVMNKIADYKRENLFGEISRLKGNYQTNTIGYN